MDVRLGLLQLFHNQFVACSAYIYDADVAYLSHIPIKCKARLYSSLYNFFTSLQWAVFATNLTIKVLNSLARRVLLMVMPC